MTETRQEILAQVRVLEAQAVARIAAARAHPLRFGTRRRLAEARALLDAAAAALDRLPPEAAWEGVQHKHAFGYCDRERALRYAVRNARQDWNLRIR